MAEKDILHRLKDLEKEKNVDEINKIIESHKYDKNPAYLYFLAHLCYTGYILPKDNAKVVSYLKEASKLGYASADFMLCTLYERADGVDRDYKLSNEYLLKACEKDYIPAINHLGEILLMGRQDLERNDQQGFEKFKYCHEQGYVKSSINLSYCLLYGVGCDPDPKEAVRILKKYSEAGYPEAQYNLGRAYFDGIGLKRDIIRANFYLQEATERGHMFAAKMLGDCYYDGIGVPIDHRMAFKFYRIAADLGNTEAAELVTHCYVYGDGVQPDYKEAMSYLVSRAQSGDVRAQVRLANYYYNGTGFRRNHYRAFYWYNEAARQESPEGLKRTGDMYLGGFGVDKDIEKAISFYEKALELKNYDAAFPLGQIYGYGKKGVRRDEEKALEYYKTAYLYNHDEKAAFEYAELLMERSEEDPEAMKLAAQAYEFAAKKRYLPALSKAGECYLAGKGVERNVDRAFRYYLIASRMGDEESTVVVNYIRQNVTIQQA